jgi:hypothetical protein
MKTSIKAQQVCEKCSVSFVIKEMQAQIALRFHFAPVRMAVMKTTNAGKEAVGKYSLYTTDGNVN